MVVSKLTQKAVFEALRLRGLTVRKRDGEYRVAPSCRYIARGHRCDGCEAQAYYTDDLCDAYKTGVLMTDNS